MARPVAEAARVRTFVGRVAARNGWQLNPDTEHLASVIEGLAANRDRHGYYLCPCREGAGTFSADHDITCPCPYAALDIAEHGHCYCGLFLSDRFGQSGAAVEPIPERRPAGPTGDGEDFL